LPKIVATKGDSTAFVRDFKNQNIVVKGDLYQIHKGHDEKYMYYILSAKPKSVNNSLLTICPVAMDESHQYDDIRSGDSLTMNGKVSGVGIWYSDRLATTLHSCSFRK
jgi:hypothetical protein